MKWTLFILTQYRNNLYHYYPILFQFENNCCLICHFWETKFCYHFKNDTIRKKMESTECIHLICKRKNISFRFYLLLCIYWAPCGEATEYARKNIVDRVRSQYWCFCNFIFLYLKYLFWIYKYTSLCVVLISNIFEIFGMQRIKNIV